MSRLLITNRNVFLSGIKQAIINRVFPTVLEAIREDLIAQISSTFFTYLDRHPMILGLRGYYAGDEERDLAAIFGLNADEGNQAADLFYDVIQNGLNINYFVQAQSIRIELSTGDLQAYLLNNSQGKYFTFSKTYGQNIEIDWMKWLFQGGSAVASITFDLNNRQAASSRSGRAVMTFAGELPSWEFSPTQVSRKGNFLLDITENRNFITELQFLISRNIREYIDRHNIEVD